jgi:hypothetical protein
MLLVVITRTRILGKLGEKAKREKGIASFCSSLRDLYYDLSQSVEQQPTGGATINTGTANGPHSNHKCAHYWQSESGRFAS